MWLALAGVSVAPLVMATHEALINCLLCANYCCCYYYYRSTSQDPPGMPIRFFLIIPVLGEKTQVKKCKQRVWASELELISRRSF